MSEHCKDCKDRTIEPNCHSTCQYYKDYIKRNEEFKKRIAKEKLCQIPTDRIRRLQNWRPQ